MTKSALFTAFLLLIYTASQAQSPQHCGATEALEMKLNEIPGLDTRLQAEEQKLHDYLENNSQNAEERYTYTIPVVVHVVYFNAQQNISDAQVMSQIDVLNEDYSMTNSDISQVRPEFENLAGDTRIRFCMADTDPDGNPTNGITRTQTTKFAWDFSEADDAKRTSQDGKDGWPHNEYLNIWVINLDNGNGVLGYAYPPGVPGWMDGVVIHYAFFGRQGTIIPPFNGGRTCTHEVGHWLNLRHIWGDGGCGQDDGVDDTPLQGTEYYGCPGNLSTCGSLDNHENFMDYTNDGCMHMFTHGQGERMLAALQGSRMLILNSNGCENAGVGINDNFIDVSDDILVFPNPTSGDVWVDCNFSQYEHGQVEIVNMFGQVVETVPSETIGSSMNFDLSNQPAGVYFVSFKSEGVAGTKKIILEK